MERKFKVSLAKLAEELDMNVIYSPKETEDIFISRPDVNRPGLQLAGYYLNEDQDRVQVFGLSELSYLESLDEELMKARVNKFTDYKPPAFIFTRGFEPTPYLAEACKERGIPLLSTVTNTSDFLATLITSLNNHLAPRITRHGVLMEVYGEGVLILGSSGVGKSETAVELLVRGHRLISDDAVEIKRVSSRTLVGSSPDNIRHFMELRGIGVINVRQTFGMGKVKMTEKVEMVIVLEPWEDGKNYDRMGTSNQVIDIMGVRVPSLTIPVKPGRNLAVIIEVAVINNRLKKIGYHPAKELFRNLGMPEEDIPTEENVVPNNFW